MITTRVEQQNISANGQKVVGVGSKEKSNTQVSNPEKQVFIFPTHIVELLDNTDFEMSVPEMKQLCNTLAPKIRASTNRFELITALFTRIKSHTFLKILVETWSFPIYENNHTLLHWAIENNNILLTNTFLSCFRRNHHISAALSAKDSIEGGTPLHWAVWADNLEIVNTILNQYSSDQQRSDAINIKDKDGLTPIQWAAVLHGDINILRTLALFKSDPVRAPSPTRVSYFFNGHTENPMPSKEKATPEPRRQYRPSPMFPFE